jgi:adenylate cyclase
MGQEQTKAYKDRSASLAQVGVGAEQLLRLLDGIKTVGNTDSLPEAVALITHETCALLKCDRATVFIVDNIREELVILNAGDAETPDIRIPWSAGLAGTVYQTGEPLNIPDAYADDRFSSDTDKQTGYKTTSLMCCPVRDAKGVIVAVMQCINKKDAGGAHIPFSASDMVLMDYLQSQVGVILRNAVARRQLNVESGRVNALLDIVRSLNAGMGTTSLVFTITNRTPALVNADRCTVYMVDHKREELWSMQGAVEIRIPMTTGLAGSVTVTGKPLNIKDAYQDERFNQDFDKKSGYRTKSILCMPVMSTTQKVIAVVQLINKLDGSAKGFTDLDERLLSGFLDIAGSILEQSQIFQKQKVQLSEMDKITGGGATKESVGPAMGGMTIAEGDEEEEEEEEEDAF